MRMNGYLDGCAGKAVYRSKADAIICLGKRMKRVRVGTNGGRRGLAPYLCNNCKRWHIGSGQA